MTFNLPPGVTANDIPGNEPVRMTPGMEGSPESVDILLALHRQPRMTGEQIARATGMSAAACKQALMGLKTRGRIRHAEGHGMASRWEIVQ